MKAKCYLLVGLFVWLAVPHLPAQTTQPIQQGFITGALTDTLGSAVAQATVTATASGAARPIQSATDSKGAYRLNLAPGAYTVRFSAAGFKTAVMQEVVVHSGEAVHIDAALVAGLETEVVSIPAPTAGGSNAPKTASEQGETSVKNLPLSSRNYTQATALAAGVSSQVSNATNIGINTQPVQVGSGSTNNYMMDGAPISAATGGAESPGIPNPDAIDGHDTQSWSYSAGPERYSGANISVTTRSGTDSFHGTLFEFVRNDIFNANDFFVKRAGLPEPVLKQNQFGFTLGGPIRRSRAFFFLSYQGTRQRNGFTNSGFASGVYLPPLPNSRDRTSVGDAFCGETGVFGGVPIGGSCNGSSTNINPVAIQILNLKLPNGAYAIPSSGATPGSSSGFLQHPYSIPATFREDQVLFNTDYALTARHKLQEKFFSSYDPQTSSFTGAGNSLPGTPTTTVTGNIYGVVKLTSTLTANLSNEMRISGQHDLLKDLPHVSFTNDEVGITSLVSDINMMDSIGVGGLFSFGGNGTWDYNSVNQYQWGDHLSWTHGRQALRLGVEVDRRQWNVNILGNARGALTFLSFADFLLGLPGCPPSAASCLCGPNTSNLNCDPTEAAVNGEQTNGTAVSNVYGSSAGGGPGGPPADVTGPDGIEHAYRFADASGYIQDNIRPYTRLTLNAGLRWDYFGPPSDSTGNLTSFWPSLSSPWIAPPAGGTYAGFVVPSNFAGSLPAGVIRNTRNTPTSYGSPWVNFAPRLGFSWQPLSKSSLIVRGGYGLFYDRPDAMSMEASSFSEVPYVVPVGGSGQANYQAGFAQPFQAATLGWGSPRLADATSNLNLAAIEPNLSIPQTQKWNLEVQKQLLDGLTLMVGYAGAHSIHSLDVDQINESRLASAGNPVNGLTTNTVGNAPMRVPYLGIATNGLAEVQTQGAAKYNSLQAVLSERTSNGVHAQAAYMFSKLLADSGGMMGLAAMNSNDPLNARQQYGPAGMSAPQRLAVNYGWDLPWKLSGMRGKVMSGWGVSGITIVQSGTPMMFNDSRGGTVFGNAGMSRAQFAPGMGPGNVVIAGGARKNLNAFFNAAAFCMPPDYGNETQCGDPTQPNLPTIYGNTSVGFALGPGQANTDISLSKATAIKESRLEFRAEFFNAFNHAQFQPPDTNVTDRTFGEINSCSVNPRLIQFALKYSF